MLYANPNAQDFHHIAEVFRKIGIPEKTISLMPDYLNPENERDDTLLEGITPTEFSDLGYGKRNDLEKAIRKDIDRLNSEEVYKRWFLFLYAIAGATCSNIGLHSVNLEHEKLVKLRMDAWKEKFGSDAEAIDYAILMTSSATGSSYYRFMNSKMEKPEICLKAMQFTENALAKLVLAVYALNGLTPPEKKTFLQKIFTPKNDPLVEEALKHIETATYRKGQFEERYLWLAVAQGAVFSEKHLKLFATANTSLYLNIASVALEMPIDPDGILDVIESQVDGKQDYIEFISHTITNKRDQMYYYRNNLPSRDRHLKQLAERFPAVYKRQMGLEKNPEVAVMMQKILMEVDKTYTQADAFTLQEKTKQSCVEALSEDNPNHKQEISDFLYGKTSTADFLAQTAPNLAEMRIWGGTSVNYISAYGIDEFAERCICFQCMFNAKEIYPVSRVPAFSVLDNAEKLIPILRKHEVPLELILNVCGRFMESIYNAEKRQKLETIFVGELQKIADEIVQADLNLKFMWVEGRILYVKILGTNRKYTDQLFAMADDGSKVVRGKICNYLPLAGASESTDEKILALLQAKKISKREIAVTLLEKKFPDSFREAVQKAFEIEKNAGLQERFAKLLGAEIPEEAKSVATEDIVTSLTKGNKVAKIAWLFTDPFTAVHKNDGTEVDEKQLKALLLVYASDGSTTRTEISEKLTADIKPAELENFVGEVFARWIQKGAEAKQKWILYLYAIYGGLQAVTSIQHYIKDWSEHSRGAIASVAVNALAMNGSSSALMAVDNMARKFKNRQVRGAANTALEQAASSLNITREELADRIVPDLGFDENLCRVFDYGTRQFNVYLTPDLTLEIFEGEKKLKNLPKAGTKDDPEKAEIASKAFKDMKKEMKTAIQSQKQRLEYVLLCPRTWTADGWKDLFIRKPIMHCFAIGLIWGVYEDNKLIQTFRYTEEGTLNTVDEDEYTLPENAVIGLVHPIELDEDTISQWQEQLSDYEITQPFPQLSRPVYRLTDEEKKVGMDTLQRFSGNEIANMTLLSRMTKYGWNKGSVEDAGYFYTFYRSDVIRQEKQPDGKMKRIGYDAQLHFSGMYVAGYDMDMETVTIEKIDFTNVDGRWDDTLDLKDLNERYISEIIAQLMAIVGTSPQEETA
ncbi:MAG: DUF4132 domain-containing protein [Oscillospiraceae bacterium]